MKQGASRHAIKDRKDDLYETPEQAVTALLRVERLPKVVWDPCAGRGAISRHLEAAGHTVIKHDLVAYDNADPGIITSVDFLMEQRPPKGCRSIVMNAPYKLADDFIYHGLSLGCRVFAFLRLMALEGVDGRKRGSGVRSMLIDKHLVRVWAGKERLPMMHREGWEGKRNESAGVPFAWFVFYPEELLPYSGVVTELRRMSWRDTA